jgi:hypothetical protein
MNVDEDTIRRTLNVYQDHMTGDDELADAVRSRVRSDRRKRLAVVGGVMSAVLLVGAAWALESQTSMTTDVASDGEPSGKAVGERLGLEPVEFPAEGCEQYVGYDPHWGFCLDGFTDDETELVLTSQEIMGYEMTDARVAYVTAIIEMRNYWRPETPEDEAKYKELGQIVDATKGQLQPLYEPMDLADFEGLNGVELADAAGLIPTRGIPIVGTGTPGFEMDDRNYDLDGVARTDAEAEDWISRISGRDTHREFMPDVVGLTETQAIRLLEVAGFTDVQVQRESSERREGSVLSQVPEGGQRYPRDFWVRIYVSSGDVAP